MRRADRQIANRSEIDEIIRGCEVCRLGFAAGGAPYVVPVAFGYDGGSLYFHTARKGKKIDCIRENPRVCFEMDRDVQLIAHKMDPCEWGFSFESVIGHGVVVEVFETEEKVHGLNQIMSHYSGAEWRFKPMAVDKTRVWRIPVESVTGKRSDKKAM